MRKTLKVITAALIPVLICLISAAPSFACIQTTFFGCVDEKNGIFTVLNVVLTVLSYGIGILATIGIVISGITYLTARDNETQVAKAKSRIIQIIIGVAVYAILWTFLQWILPGGIFGDGS